MERKDPGGSYLSISDPNGFIDANVGTPKYVKAYSYMYEYPGLLEHIDSAIPLRTPIAYINHVSVEPESRKRGLGTNLMEWMLQELRDRGIIHVYGHMGESKGKAKERLRRWLEKFGFEIVDCCHEDILPVVALTL